MMLTKNLSSNIPLFIVCMTIMCVTESAYINVMSCRISPSTGKYGPEKTQYMNTFHAVGLVSRFRSISLPRYRVKNNLSLEVTYFSPVLHFISKRINLQGKSNLVSL